MKRYNIFSPEDITSSKDYTVDFNTRDYYKGTSFRMVGAWTPNVHYYNDDYTVDFVSYKGALLYCTKDHTSTDNGPDKPQLIFEGDSITNIRPNEYWSFVMSGSIGPEGRVWVPNVSPDGVISWRQEENSPSSIPSQNIKGLKGDKGDTPNIHIVERNGEYYWYSGNDPIRDPITNKPMSAKGPKGDPGEKGKVYVPTLKDKEMIFTLSPSTKDSFTVDMSIFTGKDGKTPSFFREGDILYYSYGIGSEIQSLGNIRGPIGRTGERGERGFKGDKGEKGDQGKEGPTHELKIGFNAELGMSILYCRLRGEANWQELGPVGGCPGKSPKLIRVFGNPESEIESELNDRILWGYDGVPVSKWTTLCYLDELKGDQNIEIGCPYNLNKYYEDYDEFGGPIDHYKIWYDPCDEAVDKFSVSDFLYQAYLSIGGNMTKEEFEKAFSNIETSKFSIKFETSFEALGDPTEDKQGILYIVPSEFPEQGNLFSEYVVVKIEGGYTWEQFGTKLINVEGLATKDDLKALKAEILEEVRRLTVFWSGKFE